VLLAQFDNRSNKVLSFVAVAFFSCADAQDHQKTPHVVQPQSPVLTGVDLLCQERREEVFNPNQRSFANDMLRWSCADSRTVSGINRGSEYCEYFAVVRLPGAADPLFLGLVNEPEAAVAEALGDPEQNPHHQHLDYTASPSHVTLTAGDRAALEKAPETVVGECVFSSWNRDAQEPLPCEANETCPEMLGVPASAATNRMRFGENSLKAAHVLVEDCFYAGLSIEAAESLYEQVNDDAATSDPDASEPDAGPSEPTTENLGDPIAEDAGEEEEGLVFTEIPDEDDPFLRGCYVNAALNETPERRSDAVLCAAAMRMGNCGCDSTVEAPLFELLSPPERRGFPLGSWVDRNAPPLGCRFLDVGDAGQTQIACPLNAADLMRGASDVKQACRDMWASDVVVHAPVPAQLISCDPELRHDSYGIECETPWLVKPLTRTK